MTRKKKIIAVLIVAIVGTIVFWKRDYLKRKLGLEKGKQEGEKTEIDMPKNTGISYHSCSSFPYKLGCKGKMVKNIQIILNSKYGEDLKKDGYFGPKTQEALQRAGYGKSLEKDEAKDFINNS